MVVQRFESPGGGGGFSVALACSPRVCMAAVGTPASSHKPKTWIWGGRCLTQRKLE